MLIDAIRELIGFLRPYPRVLPAVAGLGVIASLAEGLSIGLMIPFLASLMQGVSPGGSLVARVVEGYAALFPPDLRLIAVSVSIVALVVASCLVNFAYLRVLAHAATQVNHDLRVRLFAAFVDSDELFLEQGSQGRQIKAIDGASFRVGQAVISFCLLIASACTIVVFVALLLLISWPMTVMVMAGVLAAGLIVRLFIARSMIISCRFEAGSSLLSETAVQVLSTLRMVRIFGQERRESERFARDSEAVHKAQFKLELVRRAMGPLFDGLSVPLLIGTLVIAWYANVSVAILLPFLFLVFRLQRYVRELDLSRVRIAADAGAIFEVCELLERAAVPNRARRGHIAFSGLRDRIRFDDVSFVHGSGEEDTRGPALRDASLTISRGETLAIVGGSGAGKSTLVNLLCGIYVPSAGTITVDGVDLNDLEVGSWRQKLGFAGQDADLRPGTVRENIAYGEPDASMSAVIAAAEQANIRAFIEGLPEGFETPVGVRGMQLSGGERQRIALARALLRQPDILILDEATNAVDNVTEAVIRQTLEGLAGSLTMIIIAHRLSSIRHADRVVVMEAGRIVETGKPETLLQGKGAFSALSRLETASAMP